MTTDEILIHALQKCEKTEIRQIVETFQDVRGAILSSLSPPLSETIRAIIDDVDKEII